ncbi:MAG: energy-coupling factor transporter transmembrane component T [Patulibacter sp.]|nr:energy-coupling factor transporter transmembrane component T [Patulibacter sp.]
MTHPPAGRRGAAVRSVRPRISVVWFAVLLLVTLVLRHPAALAAFLVGVAWLAIDAGAGDILRRTWRLAVPFTVLLFAIQVLVDRNGLTVLARLGDAGPLGRLDVTLEAVAGATTQALRVLAGITVTVLSLALVDVDRVLASVRRHMPRFGVTATLALRLAPAIAADGRRYADGLRCRADGRLGAVDRARVVSALLARTLDRAGDAAAILDLRGFGHATLRASPAPRRRLSRIERATVAAAGGTAALLVGVEASGLDRFATLPSLHGVGVGVGVAVGAALACVSGGPLAATSRDRGAR